MDQSDKNVKRIDTWRLSAIVNELTAECDSFDPEIARELFDSLPEEKSSRVQVSLTSTTTTPTAQGETNAGPASFEETEEKNFRFGYSKGTYAGKWRVTKEADSVTIEPKFHNDDKEFYKLFNEFAESLIKASRILREMFSYIAIEEDKERIRQKIQENAQSVRLLEAGCDSLEGQIRELLRDAPQPPYDADYISELAHRLDDIMDYMERAATRFEIYKFPSSDPAMKSLAEYIEQSCVVMAQIILLLPKRGGIDALCEEVRKLESMSDSIHYTALDERVMKIRADQEKTDALLSGISDDRILNASNEELRPLMCTLLHVALANRDYSRHIWLVIFLRDIWQALEQATDSAKHMVELIQRMERANG